MTRHVKVELNHSGFRSLLTGPEVTAYVDSLAAQLAREAGSGFVVKPAYGSFGGGRHVAHVGTGTLDAMRAQARDKALTRALHSMGGGA